LSSQSPQNGLNHACSRSACNSSSVSAVGGTAISLSITAVLQRTKVERRRTNPDGKVPLVVYRSAFPYPAGSRPGGLAQGAATQYTSAMNARPSEEGQH